MKIIAKFENVGPNKLCWEHKTIKKNKERKDRLAVKFLKGRRP